MTPLWLVPIAVAVLGAAVLAATVQRLLSELAELRRASARAAQLRPALVPVVSDAERVRQHLESLRRH